MNNEVVTNSKEPITQLPLIAFFLAIAAGTMDGYAYFTTKTFATFQSGNIILSGYTLATDDIVKLIPTVISILCFGLGAASTAIIRNWNNCRNKVWTFTILSIEMIVLVLLSLNPIHNLFLPLHIAWILAFLAGMQGNAFHKINGMLYGNIAVTLNVQLAFNYLAETFFKSNADKSKLMFQKFWDYFLVLIGFALGAGISALLAKSIGSYALIFTAVALACIFIYGKVALKKDHTALIDSNN